MALSVLAFKTVVLILLSFIFGCDCDISTAHLGDPEPEVTWTPPADERKFTEKREEAYYSGLLWAGKDEFNWIVDIRTEDNDQENWAVGNLISNVHVLTSCTAVDKLNTHSFSCVVGNHSQFHEFSVDDYDQRCQIRIYYCQDYLWRDGQFDASSPPDRDFSVTGWRSPKQLLRHVSCHNTLTLLLYDVAIISLNKAIPPVPPRLGYMPMGYNYATDQVVQMVDLDPNKPITYQSPFCYVASFGRNPVNFQEHYVLDYKVKYRVYITYWKDCMDRWKYICNDDDEPGCGNEDRYDNSRSVWCFRPRAKIGTVCAHDRGAPLVCNGQVVGLVLRGAELRYCNNMYKIPFVVENIYNYHRFLTDSVHFAVHPPRGATDPPGRGAIGAAPTFVFCISSSCLWLGCWVVARYINASI